MKNEYPVEMVSLGELKPHPRNYVIHPEDQLLHLMASIKQHGMYRNIVIARDNVILAGHGVRTAALRLGIETAPVIRLDIDSDSPAALKVLAGDNEVRHLAEIDDRALTEILKDVMSTEGLLGTGYDEMMLAGLAMVTRPASEIADYDAAAEWVGLPEYDNADETYSVIVSCPSAAIRSELFKLLGVVEKHGWEVRPRLSVSWPDNTPRDFKSVAFTQKDEQ